MANGGYHNSLSTLKTNNFSERLCHLVNEKIAAKNAVKQQGTLRVYFRRIWQYHRDKSLCCLPPNNIFRKYARKLVDWTYPFYMIMFSLNEF